MNNKLLKTILFSVNEKINILKENLSSQDKIIDQWANNELIPTIKEHLLTSFQIKDRLNVKNQIIVSVPSEEKLYPDDMLHILNNIIDPEQNFPYTKLLI